MQRSLSFILLFAIVPAVTGQQIVELGSWSNNANFSLHYLQDRLITSTTTSITFLDVSEPSAPLPAASIGNPAFFPMAIATRNGYAYFGGGMTGFLMIADISNINMPVQTGITMDVTGTAYQIALKGDHAFMPTNTDSLYAIDISDPASPVVTDRIGLSGFSTGIAIKGDHAFVGTTNGLKVIDISDPANMAVSTSYGNDYSYIAEDTLNNRLIVAKTGQGFDVIDISDPMQPALSFQGIGGNSIGRLVHRNGVVLQIGTGNVSAFLIGPNSSQFLTSYNATFTGQVNDVAVKDSVFFVSTVNHVHVLGLSGVPVGIEDYDLQNVSIFPNPASEEITVDVGMFAMGSSITVFDQTGRLVMHRIISGSITTLDLCDLSIGTYILELSTSNDLRSRQLFLKQ